jgi:hypothetical protein
MMYVYVVLFGFRGLTLQQIKDCLDNLDKVGSISPGVCHVSKCISGLKWKRFQFRRHLRTGLQPFTEGQKEYVLSLGKHTIAGSYVNLLTSFAELGTTQSL